MNNVKITQCASLKPYVFLGLFFEPGGRPRRLGTGPAGASSALVEPTTTFTFFSLFTLLWSCLSSTIGVSSAVLELQVRSGGGGI